jgi:hypothetical protein
LQTIQARDAVNEKKPQQSPVAALKWLLEFARHIQRTNYVLPPFYVSDLLRRRFAASLPIVKS